MSVDAVFETNVTGLRCVQRGKVRDIYEVDSEHLLIVTTDRLSAFDVILPDPIPGKGKVLTAMSNFWFARMASIIDNHLVEFDLRDIVVDASERAPLEGRSILVRRLDPLPIEAVARGYLIGSGWKDYQACGAVCGVELPQGLEQAAALDKPIFTPATKAAVGDHDENISFDTASELIGRARAEQVREVTLNIYREAAEFARRKGIIIADTKFEFGLDRDGRLVLIDEILTPDSSRFWPAEAWRTGISPPSYDKQFVRDYLETLDWDKRAPGPRLPAEVAAQTAAKYREALERLTH